MSQVLIVEDQVPMRRLLRKWVEAEDAAVIEAGSAEEALDLVTRTPDAAVALCDLRLPGLSGLWLAERLRTAAPHTSVVMTSGLQEFDMAVRSLQTGAVDYVAKPFSRERLLEALHRAFAAHTARRAVAAMRDELETGRARVTEALAEVEMTTSGILAGILGILETTEPGARDRARRTARLSVNLALALNVREPDLSAIEHAALLHDAGSLITSEQLKGSPFLPAARDLIERTRRRAANCSPSPAGASIAGRILTAAVAFDRLVDGSRRLAPADALAEMRARAGEFDPGALEALAALYESPAVC